MSASATYKNETLRREFDLSRDSVNADSRTVELCFATEAPVERYFGNEVLDMGAQSVRMDRLNRKAPLLLNHNPDDQIGVVESARVDADKKARAVVRFSKSARGEEIFQDVKDGIRSLVSVGYRIHKLTQEKPGTSEEVHRAIDWEPLEISIVSIPADPSAGVGRAMPEPVISLQAEVETKTKSMSATVVTAAPDLDVVRSDAITNERKRIADIRSVATRHKLEDLADKAIADGATAEQFGSRALEELAKRGQAKPVAADAGNIGMSEKEVREFSIVRAIRALSTPGGVLDGLEREASDALAKKLGRSLSPTQFLIPNEVATRSDLTAGTGSAGGYTVQTTVGPLIPLLRNKMRTAEAGVMQVSGLVGNVSFPKLSAAATAYWLSEDGSGTGSVQTFGQVSVTPHRLAAFTDVSKQLLAQSTVDMEGVVRGDLATILAIAADKAVIEGSGSSNQPTGILNTSGINTVTFGGTATWASVLSFVKKVEQGNADAANMKWISTPATKAAWKATAKVSNYPSFLLDDNNEADGYEFLNTNQVSSDKVYFGDWSQAMFCTWAGISVLVDPYTQATSGLVRIVADMYCDVGVRQAHAFCASTDSGAQ